MSNTSLIPAHYKYGPCMMMTSQLDTSCEVRTRALCEVGLGSTTRCRNNSQREHCKERVNHKARYTRKIQINCCHQLHNRRTHVVAQTPGTKRSFFYRTNHALRSSESLKDELAAIDDPQVERHGVGLTEKTTFTSDHM